MMARTCNELDSADGCSILLPEERPPKKKNGLKKTEKKASSGGISSLASNNKEPAFTWITELTATVCILIAYEPKNKWIPLLMFGILLSGANGKRVKFEQKPYRHRHVSIATNETIVATEPVSQAHSYLILARSSHYPGSYECTQDFVTKHQNCNIVPGEENKTECEGLQISGNKTYTHLTVDGSKLAHDTMFCILEQVPELIHLYLLEVSKKRDQAPKTTDWKLAFVIVVPFLSILCAIFAFFLIRERLTSIKLRSKSTKQVHKNGTEMRHRQNCQSVRFSRISFEV